MGGAVAVDPDVPITPVELIDLQHNRGDTPIVVSFNEAAVVL